MAARTSAWVSSRASFILRDALRAAGELIPELKPSEFDQVSAIMDELASLRPLGPVSNQLAA